MAAGLGMMYWALFHPDHLHFHMTKAYAHLGHKEAQATVGHKLLHGETRVRTSFGDGREGGKRGGGSVLSYLGLSGSSGGGSTLYL